ncbi:11318_t:CDS:2 [Entrophospora sp. SA101]|nr:11318_t:CDS:2 [Entrophospora sp. SA101]
MEKINKSHGRVHDKCSIKEKEGLDNLSLAIFGSGLPLSIVENQYFINFCKKLHPAYELPSRKTLTAVKLLNEKYNEITENNNNQIEKSKYVCITSDDTTNEDEK